MKTQAMKINTVGNLKVWLTYCITFCKRMIDCMDNASNKFEGLIPKPKCPPGKPFGTFLQPKIDKKLKDEASNKRIF